MSRLSTLLTGLVIFSSWQVLPAQWTQVQTGFGTDFNCVHMVDTSIVLIGGEAGLLIRSTDGGQTWSQVFLPSTEDVEDFVFTTVNSGFALTNDELLLTSDQGQSWTAVNINPADDLEALGRSSDNAMIAVGKTGAIARSGDGGLNWSNTATGSVDRLEGIAYAGSDTAVAVGRNGTLLRSTDDGLNWTALAPGTVADLKDVLFLNSSHGFIAAGEHLLATSDAGATWNLQTTPADEDLNALHFADASMAFAVGEVGEAIMSQDGGQSWLAESTPTIEELNDVHFADAMLGFAVGNFGTVIKRGGAPDTTMTSIASRHRDIRMSVFPNPMNERAQVRVEASPGARLLLLDVLGNAVRSLTAAPGATSVVIDREELQAGMYFLQLVDSHGEVLQSTRITMK